ncbi:MAG: PLP-dependent aspartate aminotransferase family protein, partial [Pseudomonadota bacterium]
LILGDDLIGHAQRCVRGIEVTFYDAGVPDALAAAIRPGQTRMVWVETPTNPNWQITDIAAAADVAHSAGARLIVDATVSPACTTRALDLGADLVFQSATKYLNGHSDITGGGLSVATVDPWWEEIRDVRTLQGTAMAAFEAWLLIRGLRTLHLRFDRASASALALAAHFQGHPALRGVLYPGLPNHPGHAIAARQMTGGFGGMLSILASSEGAARKIASHTQVMLPATSLGGVETLIEHRMAVEPPGSAVAPELLRISVGIEAVEDLIADLEQAIERAQ